MPTKFSVICWIKSVPGKNGIKGKLRNMNDVWTAFNDNVLTV